MTFRAFLGNILNMLNQIKRDALLLVVYLMLRTRKFQTRTGLLDFAFSGSFGMIKPSQVRSEIEKILELLDCRKAKNGLEIGTNNGGTLFLFANTISQGGTLVSVDLPGGLYGGGYSSIRIPFYKSFAVQRRKIALIRCDSHTLGALAAVKKTLDGTALDFVFIDGDHTYKGVKTDFEMYSPLVKRGGMVIFHDIADHPPILKCEASQFWNEIKEKYKHDEIIEDPSQGWAGVGVIYMP